MSLASLRQTLARGPAVSPFLVLGDPTPALSVELARAAARGGADMLEIGFPYSDPVADGPAIQAAAARALAAGVSTRAALALLGRVAAACPGTPLNLLVYGNLVHRVGYERFASEAAEAGASTLLVPDIPLEESGPLRRGSRRAGLGHVELAGPLTPAHRLHRLARGAIFLYLAGFQGVTGVRRAGFAALPERVREAAESVDLPVAVGFGLSGREQIASVFRSGARIAVVGSHLARIIERWFGPGPELPGGPEVLITNYESAVRRLTNKD